MYQNNVVKKNILMYYQQEKKERDTMFLSNILILPFMIIPHIMEKTFLSLFSAGFI